MRCDLCGGINAVAIYGYFPGDLDFDQFDAQTYCDACVSATRKRNVRHAAFVFFLPTVGLMRLFKFAFCSRQEMGDWMAASALYHGRDPRTKHILWPMGAEGYATMEQLNTRQSAEKKLRKAGGGFALDRLLALNQTIQGGGPDVEAWLASGRHREPRYR